MRHSLFVLAAALLASSPVAATAQNEGSVVRGRVLDAQTLRPLEGAQVAGRPDTLARAETDAAGRFELRAPAGRPPRDVVVRRIGYAPQVVRAGAGELTVALEPAAAQLTAVRVTGFETDRPLLETPGSVALLTARDLNRFDNSSILPALNAVPGVRVDQRQPGGSTRLSIRGSVLRSPFGIRNVRVYWNDIPLTLADGTSPADVFDVGSVGTVEVIKGPAGSAYGAGTGGVIKLQSVRAQGETGPELALTGGGYGYRRATATYRVSAERASVVATAVRQDHDGYRTVQDFSRRELYQVQAQLFPSERSTVSINAYHARPAFGLPGNLTRAEVNADRRQANPWSARYGADARRERTYVGASNAQRLTSWLTNTTSLYGTFTDWSGNGGTAAFNGSVLRENGGGYGGRTRFGVELPRGLPFPARIVAGGEFQTDRVQSLVLALDTNRVRGAPQNNVEVRSHQYLLFAQLEAELPASVLLTGGLSYNETRYDVLDVLTPAVTNFSGRLTFDPTVSPRVAAVKTFGENLAVHGSVSVGYSPPTLFELNPDGTVNRDLEAERGTQYELGARGARLADRLRFDVAAYLLQLRNTIVARTTERGVTAYENVGATDQRGLEANVYADLRRPGDGGYVTLLRPWAAVAVNDYTFATLRLRDDQAGAVTDLSGRRVPGVPLQTVTLALDVEMRPGFYANVTSQRVGRVQVDNANTESADPYTLLGVRAGVRRSVALLSGRLLVELFGGIDNALDEEYTSFLAVNGFGGRYYNPSLPRNYYGGVSLRAAR